MSTKARNGRLYLNNRHVGDVMIRGWHGHWGVGDFVPVAAFAEFAPIFARWAQVMHADQGPVSAANADRLRSIECQMYRLHARLWIDELRQWRIIDILNIDGPLIEWKEGWASPNASPNAGPNAGPEGGTRHLPPDRQADEKANTERGQTLHQIWDPARSYKGVGHVTCTAP